MRRVILACAILLVSWFSTGKAEAPVKVASIVTVTKNNYSREEIIQKISSAAIAYNIDQNIALAIAEVESNFNPNVELYEPKFKTFSVGLFQMFLPTARSYGFSGTKQSLKNPNTNIRLGMLHLTKCSERFDGNVSRIACCHNAGIAVDEKKCLNNKGVKEYIQKVLSKYEKWKMTSI